MMCWREEERVSLFAIGAVLVSLCGFSSCFRFFAPGANTPQVRGEEWGRGSHDESLNKQAALSLFYLVEKGFIFIFFKSLFLCKCHTKGLSTFSIIHIRFRFKFILKNPQLAGSNHLSIYNTDITGLLFF